MSIEYVQIIERQPEGDFLIGIFRKDGKGLKIDRKKYKSWAQKRAEEVARFFGVPIKELKI